MKISKAIKDALAKARLTDGYWVERAKLDFSVALERHRRLANLSYADVARTIGTSPAYITKVFRGDSNLTIETMVKLARATGAQLHIDLCQAHTQPQRWAKLATIGPVVAANQKLRPVIVAESDSYVAANGTYGA